MKLVKTGCLLLIMLAWIPSTAHARYKMQHDGPPQKVVTLKKARNTVPKSEPLSLDGNPSHYNVDGKTYEVMNSAKGYQEIGTASWYGVKFHGELTSNREKYDMFEMTAASKTLPLPTYVKVENLENGREIVVRVNDRGPFVDDRIIDLSYAAATRLGMIAKGTAKVRVTALTTPHVINHKTKEITHELGRFLQIGSFREQDNALKLIAKVSKFTPYPLRIRATNGQKGIIYRVELGPFDEVHHVNQAKSLLKEKGIFPVFARLG